MVQKLLFIGFVASAALFWPGLLRPDSIWQMQQGISGVFNDFHPPMLGLVLGLFKGPVPIFLVHLALYWGAVAIYANAQKPKAKWYLLIAIFPPVFSYQLLVIKDIAFVNSYVFACAWLHFYSMRGIRPSNLSFSCWLVVVFYGTASAYQAAIALPWLCLWLGKIYCPGNAKKWIYCGVGVFIALISSVVIFNKTIATPCYSNQHLKLYDLSGISKQIDRPIFASYLVKNPNFDFKRIKNLYNTKRVDDLTFIQDTPLPQAINDIQREELQSAWINAITEHPLAYLRHRLGIFWNQLTVSFLKRPSKVRGDTQTMVLKALGWLGDSWIFMGAQWLMACIGYVIIQFFLLYKGFKHFNEGPRYLSLFFQNASALSLIAALFFVANAAEARYAYLTVAMCCFSFPSLLSSSRKQ